MGAVAVYASALVVAFAGSSGGGETRVVISTSAATADVVRAVADAGGTVEQRLDALGTVVADLPEDRVADVAAVPGVTGLRADREVALATTMPARADAPRVDPVDAIGARSLRAAGLDGRGVDVAVIDSGVVPVPALAGRVVAGPDFSPEAALANLATLDGFGHGTHLASLIAGDDPAAGIAGVAPGARIVNVKVADHDGRTELSSLMQALEWVVANRNRNGLNIRVVNLAFGVPASGLDDPLAQAVEKAWRSGVVVVSAVGNGGNDTASVDSPALNPYVLAVGAVDAGRDPGVADDVVAGFSAGGNAERSADVVAPGVALVGARVPGGALDAAFPEARVGEGGFRGSGTSQATAVTAGAAALLVQADPKLSPNDVKYLLRQGAEPVPAAPSRLQGRGALHLDGLVDPKGPGGKADQKWKTGTPGDPFKRYWDAEKKLRSGKGAQSREALTYDPSMTGNRWSGNRWSGNRWSGNRWSGDGWG